MSLFLCPVCGGVLCRGDRAYRCENGHSYDISAEGTTYLLPPNRKHSKEPGDDRGMASARSAFLSRGYYEPLRQRLCALAVELTGASPTVLDAGCGEGYYTSGLYRALCRAGKTPDMAGVDISKFCLRRAAKREKNVELAVASVYHLPVAADRIDLLLNCFSPLAQEEFARVLRPGGHFLYVVPGARHLWQMKEILYEHPYPNATEETPYAGFVYDRIEHVTDTVTVESQADLHALFQMTPYYWKTPRAGSERLAQREMLTTRIEFDIHVFTKK